MLVSHTVEGLVWQRVCAPALGYEDVSDHDQVRQDPPLVAVFVEAHTESPQRIVLDLDTTDLPLHGHQEGRFFHGYYDEYCCLPRYIIAGERLLCARLRAADRDASAGSTEEVERIVPTAAVLLGDGLRADARIEKAPSWPGRSRPRFDCGC